MISTDKAVSPINLYGATKLTAEKLIISANIFKGRRKCKFSVVRYGNVMGSRGSVIPLLIEQNMKKNLPFTITDKRMTRFNITLDEASDLVLNCLNSMKGEEVFVPKLPSYNIVTLAKAVNSQKKIRIIGIRKGEKLHEELISSGDFQNCKEFRNFYIIYPLGNLKTNKKVVNFSNSYNSFTNKKYLNSTELKKLIQKQLKNFEK